MIENMTFLEISQSMERLGFPGDASSKEPDRHCRRHKRCGFDPWVRKIPWREGRATQEDPLEEGRATQEDPLEEGRATHSSIPA